MEMKLTLTVNGKTHTLTTDGQRTLLEVLREDLHLTGTKYGCGEGVCHACTVLMEGEPTLACMTPAAVADKKSITTIEGLAKGALHPVQEAFVEEQAAQCGYCTSGMILEAAALLEKTPHPTDEEIVTAMNGHICRCNNYPAILNAIRRAARQATEVSPS